ncbi:MAG: hypothetical protein AB7I27_17825 [Bacteriovoracaceae bacterium]
MICSLNSILEYENPAVVSRFNKAFPKDAYRAEVLFKDLLRFFWTSEKLEQDQKQKPMDESLQFTFIMDEEMMAIVMNKGVTRQIN